MRTSWADSLSNSHIHNVAAPPPSAGAGGGASRPPPRSSYVPPHLQNRSGAAEPVPTSSDAFVSGGRTFVGGGSFGGSSGNRGGGWDSGNQGSGYGYGMGGGEGRGGGGWNNRGTGGWDRREREVNPFENDDAAQPAFEEQENTGINFDAYEDIPVETSGENVPPPVNTFAEIDLGDAVNENIRRCKYVKPTPVQRHAIPILLAGRDLMACAQTGSGKTAAFCFPIISGITRGQPPQRPPRGARTVYPLSLILSPTRELSCQVSYTK